MTIFHPLASGYTYGERGKNGAVFITTKKAGE